MESPEKSSFPFLPLPAALASRLVDQLPNLYLAVFKTILLKTLKKIAWQFTSVNYFCFSIPYIIANTLRLYYYRCRLCRLKPADAHDAV